LAGDKGPQPDGISRVSPRCALSWPAAGFPTPRISAPLVQIGHRQTKPAAAHPRRPARHQAASKHDLMASLMRIITKCIERARYGPGHPNGASSGGAVGFWHPRRDGQDAVWAGFEISGGHHMLRARSARIPRLGQLQYTLGARKFFLIEFLKPNLDFNSRGRGRSAPEPGHRRETHTLGTHRTILSNAPCASVLSCVWTAPSAAVARFPRQVGQIRLGIAFAQIISYMRQLWSSSIEEILIRALSRRGLANWHLFIFGRLQVHNSRYGSKSPLWS
jgi:hypothetical protein